MLHVNEDTNDNLFRKAAEDYFLKGEEPAWENYLTKNRVGEEDPFSGSTHMKNKTRLIKSFLLRTGGRPPGKEQRCSYTNLTHGYQTLKKKLVLQELTCLSFMRPVAQIHNLTAPDN